MDKIIERPHYLDWLNRWRDKDVIKVLTGVRRCGKSTLLKLYAKSLADQANTIEINLEDPDNSWLRADPMLLYRHVVEQLQPDQTNYVFIDEIQQIEGFERAADGLFIRDDVDLYLTGSNAQMLSGDLATLLSGRYVELETQPLSFAEYASAKYPSTPTAQIPRAQLFAEYLEEGSFPLVQSLGGDTRTISDYLEGLLSTVLFKDVARLAGIRDLSVLGLLVKYLADNAGNLTSARKISGALTSTGNKISSSTVQRYLSALEDAFLFYRVERYDIRGKSLLEGQFKHYIVDPGLRRHLVGTKARDTGRMLENIVFLELKRRFREVKVGSLTPLEVDFIAQDSKVTYVQVAQSVVDPETLERELAPLRKIPDYHPRLLLTLDEEPPTSHDGIQQLNALHWLLTSQ